MTRSTDSVEGGAYGPAPLEPDAMDALRRSRRRDKDAVPSWWLRARREPRVFKGPESE
jgi:hypothetical protein